MNAIDQLKSVLCDPSGKCCITGSVEDRAIVDRALQALAQPAQEPVAWMRPSEEGYDSAFRDHSTVVACTGNPWTGWVPLYTTPPAAQRTWVGLTDVNAVELWQLARHDIVEFTRAIEAKLKELNT